MGSLSALIVVHLRRPHSFQGCPVSQRCWQRGADERPSTRPRPDGRKRPRRPSGTGIRPGSARRSRGSGRAGNVGDPERDARSETPGARRPEQDARSRTPGAGRPESRHPERDTRSRVAGVGPESGSRVRCIQHSPPPPPPPPPPGNPVMSVTLERVGRIGFESALDETRCRTNGAVAAPARGPRPLAPRHSRQAPLPHRSSRPLALGSTSTPSAAGPA